MFVADGSKKPEKPEKPNAGMGERCLSPALTPRLAALIDAIDRRTPKIFSLCSRLQLLPPCTRIFQRCGDIAAPLSNFTVRLSEHLGGDGVVFSCSRLQPPSSPASIRVPFGVTAPEVRVAHLAAPQASHNPARKFQNQSLTTWHMLHRVPFVHPNNAHYGTEFHPRLKPPFCGK